VIQVLLCAPHELQGGVRHGTLGFYCIAAQLLCTKTFDATPEQPLAAVLTAAAGCPGLATHCTSIELHSGAAATTATLAEHHATSLLHLSSIKASVNLSIRNPLHRQHECSSALHASATTAAALAMSPVRIWAQSKPR
jgi:hypothetical protein